MQFIPTYVCKSEGVEIKNKCYKSDRRSLQQLRTKRKNVKDQVAERQF